MKVLIDENLPRKLASHLKGHECRTVAECGLARYQQDLKSGRIAILIVRAASNRSQALLPIIPDCLVALKSIEPGS
jgi:hypothetical protein